MNKEKPHFEILMIIPWQNESQIFCGLRPRKTKPPRPPHFTHISMMHFKKMRRPVSLPAATLEYAPKKCRTKLSWQSRDTSVKRRARSGVPSIMYLGHPHPFLKKGGCQCGSKEKNTSGSRSPRAGRGLHGGLVPANCDAGQGHVVRRWRQACISSPQKKIRI